MSLVDLKKVWEAVRFSGGVLAGGCVRDTLNHRPVKDYDLYITEEQYEHHSHRFTKLEYEEQGSDVYQHAYIAGRCLLKSSDFDVDVIVVRSQEVTTPDEAVDEFNFGICMVWYDGIFHLTEEYVKDVENKTVTLYRTEWGIENSLKHYERISVKYPEWKLVMEANNDQTFG